MKWHFWFKSLYRKLILFLSGIMGAVLLTGANLKDVRNIGRRPEINCFVEEYYLEAIKNPYNIFFSVLIIVGTALILVGRKRYDSRHRDGILVTNIGIGYLATIFGAYGITTLGYLKLMCWDVVVAFLLGAAFYGMMAKNILNYKKNDSVMEDDRHLDRAKVPVIVSAVISLVAVAAFVVFSNNQWDKSYDSYKTRYWEDDYQLMDEKYVDKRYFYVQFVNLFNTDGKNFTLEELNKSIENFESDKGSWYTLWYFNEYLYDLENSEGMDVCFSSYGYSKRHNTNFANLAIDKLNRDGIELKDATTAQMDEACKYVYDLYINQTPSVIIGDDEEISVNITIPENGNVEEVTVICDSDAYYGYIKEWYQVDVIGQEPEKDAESVDKLEDGKTYYAIVRMPFVLPYYAYEDANVVTNINGVKSQKVDVKAYIDLVTIDIWVIPGSEN